MFKFFATLMIVIGISHVSTAANAGLFFCNDSGQEIAVAVGWKQDGTWVSKGWYRILPRQCGATLLGVLNNQRYYYYAESIESDDLSWGGRGDSDAGHFCTTSKAFYLDSTSDNCAGHLFKHLWVGEEHQYTVTLTESARDPAMAALNCRSTIQDGRDSFAKCWMRNMATDKQRRILDCIEHTRSKASLAICATKDGLGGDAYKVATCANNFSEDRRGDKFLSCVAKGSLSEEQVRIFNCAVTKRGSYSAMGECALSGQLTSEQRRIYGCVADNYNNYAKAGLCAAGNQLSPEQQRIAGCVLNNKGSYMQMGVCAVGSNLTPEQQVFASCAVSTGAQPYAFAGCVGTQLTMNELQKCMTDGIGGSGCFGDNNTAVKLVRNAWKDVTEGPGPSNDLLGRDGFIGRKLDDVASDLTHGPGENNDLVGRNGFVCRTLFGGC